MKRTLVAAFAASLMFLPVALQAQSKARIIQPIDNTSLIRVPHSTHPLAAAQNDLGRVNPNLSLERMVFVLTVTPEQQSTLQKLIDAQHDPESASFRQWLAPEEFGAKFGPADEDVAKITGWLRQQGFEVGAIGRGKQFIEFSGSARQVESAFHTEMHHYTVDGEEHIANARDISLPQALTPVVSGVLSLHNFPKKAAHRELFQVHRDPATGQLVPDFTLSTPNGTAHFTAPGDFARIYNTEPLLKDKIDGSQVSIAIVGRSNINLSDVQTFRKIFGLPAKDPIFIMNGQDPGIGFDEAEADLDVEWSGAAAPGATIKFVLSSSTITTDGVDLSIIYAIDNRVAPIMSTSFSACELFLGTAGNIFFNNIYEQAAAEGITAFVSTGDTGSANCSQQVNGNPAVRTDVSGLASTPYNVAVGGTAFSENGLDGIYWQANNRADQSSAVGYIPETIWNESCDPTKDPGKCFGTDAYFMVAGGGGPSSCISSDVVNGQFVCHGGYPKPSWQAGRGVPNDGVRDLPDLSLNAGASHDGSLLCVEGSCQTVRSNGQTILENASVIGGTSVSAPTMAGIMALIEQKNGQFQGLANFNFYKLAAKDVLANCNSTNLIDPTQPGNCFFHDVTRGTNAVPIVPGYPAKTGYDKSSGLGSVNAAKVVEGWSTVTKLGSTTTLSSGAISAQHGQAVPVSVAVKPKSGTGTPSGAVDLITDRFGSVLAGTLSKGSFIGDVSGLPGGQYDLKANYSGDAMFSSSSSGSVGVNITPEESVVAVSAWDINLIGGLFPVSGPLFYGQPTALEIQVAGKSGTGAPTGNVTVADGRTILTTVPLAETGHTFVEVDNQPAGTGMLVGHHMLTVFYDGDNSFKPASSAPVKLRVIKKTGVSIITPVPGTITAGAPEKLILLVGGAGLTAFGPGVEGPSGTVQVFDNGKGISGHIPLVFQGPEGPGASQALFTVESFAPGTHNLTLHYSGDANYTSINSTPFTFSASVTVNPANLAVPQITLQQSPSTISLGQTVNYVGMVRPAVVGHPMPTGTVSLVSRNGEVFDGPVTLTNGNATLVVSFAAADQFEVTLSYSGDKNYSPFSSSILTTQVNRGKPTVSLKAASGVVPANTQTSLTVNVVGAPNNPIISQNPNATPSGTVQFFDSVNGAPAQPLGSPDFLTIGNGGNPIFTLPVVLPSGTNVITVEYSGDINWLPITSTAVTVTVN
jgi:hypothetical protein